MQHAWIDGDVAKAMRLQEMLMPVHSAMFCETSPGPVKFAAELLGLSKAESRLPITAIGDASKNTVELALQGIGALSGGLQEGTEK